MKKTTVSLIIACLAVVTLSSSALAWRSVRTGQKNFERAWRASMSMRQDTAAGYYARAADAFSQALAEVPPSRTTMFSSNLTMAGMSFYYAGRYQECVDTMDKVLTEDRSMNVWEAPLYSALASGELGNKKETVKYLNRLIDYQAYQPILMNVVSRVLPELENGSASLASATEAVGKAALQQFLDNTNTPSVKQENQSTHCSGRFWWRMNKDTCPQEAVSID